MTILQSIILGFIQGLTEFLPVSSSAHLAIAQHFFGLQGEGMLAFDVIVHVATLLAILVFFRSELFPLPKIGWRLCALIVIGTIPTVIIGFSLKNFVAHLEALTPIVIALLINSIVLWSTKWVRIPNGERGTAGGTLTVRRAILIGIAQGCAVMPGISRAGSTISAGLWLKQSRELAFRFSFFLAIPAILGALVLVIPDMKTMSHSVGIGVLGAGFTAAFVSGYAALSILYRLVVSGRFYWFGVYTFALAVALVVV